MRTVPIAATVGGKMCAGRASRGPHSLPSVRPSGRPAGGTRPGRRLSADGRRSALPGFLAWDGDSITVTEARLALRPEARADFALQLAHTRALLEEVAGLTPSRFEIVNGNGETTSIEPASAAR